jgi:hypothetical protein
MKSHLKVKVVSLSAEMTYIRRQEEKWKTKARHARQRQKDNAIAYSMGNFWTLRAHRRDLKVEARTTHLAYGCMKGIPYSKMEVLCYGKCKGYGSSEPDWQAIEDTVARFSKSEPNMQEIMQRFSEWLSEAKVWYEGSDMRIAEFMTARDKERVRRANDPIYQDAQLEHRMRAKAAGLSDFAARSRVAQSG